MSLCEKYLLQDPPSLSRLVLADKYGLTKLSKVCVEFAKVTNPGALKQEMMYDQIDLVVKVEILEHHIDVLNKNKKTLDILQPSYENIKAKSEARLKCLKEILDLAQGKSGECRECLPRKEEFGIHCIGEKDRCVDCKEFLMKKIVGKLGYRDSGRYGSTWVPYDLMK